MDKRLTAFISILVACLVSLISCTGTKLISTWKDDAFEEGYLKSVMVVALSDNDRNRRLFEDTFVTQFEGMGVKAVSSASVLAADVELTERSIREKAGELALDAIFVSHLVGAGEKSVYHPPTVTSWYNCFSDYYAQSCDITRQPGYYTRHRYVKLENNIYATKTDKLIWSSSSETVDAKTVNAGIQSLSEVIMKRLQKDNLIE